MQQKEPKVFPQKRIDEIDPKMQFATDDLRIVGWGKLDDKRTFYDETTLRVCLKIPGNYVFIDDKGGRLIKVTIGEIRDWQTSPQLIKLGAISESEGFKKNKHPILVIGKNSEVPNGINALPVDDRYEHALIKNIFGIGEHTRYPETISRDELFQLAGSVRELTDSVKADLQKREAQRNEARKGYDSLFPATEQSIQSIERSAKKQKLSERFKSSISKEND